MQHPTDLFFLEVSIGDLKADMKVLQSNYKQLKESQDAMLRTQQLLLQRVERLENVIRSSQLSRHRLRYQHVTPTASTPSISHHTSTPSSRSFRQHTLNTVAPSPSVSLVSI